MFLKRVISLFFLLANTTFFCDIILMHNCSSHSSIATANTLTEYGHTVYVITQKHKGSFIDIAKDKAVETILSKHNRIDVLINYTSCPKIEKSTSVKITQKTFDENFFGTLRLIQKVLPSMRSQENGLIINIVDVSQTSSTFGREICLASKQALEIISETILPSLETWNINISILEPFLLQTNNVLSLSHNNSTKEFDSIASPGKTLASLINKVISTNNPLLCYKTDALGIYSNKPIANLQLNNYVR